MRWSVTAYQRRKGEAEQLEIRKEVKKIFRRTTEDGDDDVFMREE